MISDKKLKANRENIAKANKAGLNKHFGKDSARWNGGNTFEEEHPCPQCGKVLKRQKRYRNRICKKCLDNRGKHFDVKKWYQKTRIKLKYFAFHYLGNKCKDCKVDNLPICCYHFHHREPMSKEFNVGRMFVVKNYERLTKELNKCDLLCANCHAIRHWKVFI